MDNIIDYECPSCHEQCAKIYGGIMDGSQVDLECLNCGQMWSILFSETGEVLDTQLGYNSLENPFFRPKKVH